MAANGNRTFRVELIGAVFMIVAGSVLHFAFGWFGGWRPLALVAAVNESIWEHLKLAFWPGLFWGMVIRPPEDLNRANVLAAKGFSLLATAALIVAISTSYSAILGRSLLPLDIGTFVAAILIGQCLSGWSLTRGFVRGRAVRRIGLALLMLQLFSYSVFTFFPPNHWLFIEERSGLRGIQMNDPMALSSSGERVEVAAE